jgi:hypothetical protein
MKIVYMEQTLNLLVQRDGIEETNKLISQGKLVVTETVKYLKIEE